MSQHRIEGLTVSFGGQSGADPSKDAVRQLERAESLRQQEQFDRALTLCEPLVARYPDYFGALYTLGMIYADKRQFPQALGCLVRAVMQNPRNWKALTSLGAVYLELGAPEMAAQTMEQARLINPREPSIFATLGEIYRTEREYELAYEAHRSAVELDSSLKIAAVGLGLSCMHLGRFEEGAKVFEALIKRGGRSLVTLTGLAELPPSLVKLDVLSEVAKLTPEKSANKTEFDNAVAIVKATALDKLGKAEEAWQLLSKANQSIFASRQEDLRNVRETERTSLDLVRTRRFKPYTAAPAKTISLFILGPSRSGKTSMEALMSVLPGVKRGYENPLVETAVRRTFQSAGFLTDSAFNALPPMLDAQCREAYLDELTRRAGSAKVFTNTHPVRIHDAARMASTFPGVRLLFVKRNLEDNLLRIFMRKYGVGNSYSYDVKAARDHIVWYHQMMDELAAKLPDIVRVVRYEDMVEDPRAAVRAGAELCGLDVPDVALPAIGDDRNCAQPYRAWIEAALS